MLLKLRNSLAGIVRDIRFSQADLNAEIAQSQASGESLGDWWERQHTRKAKYWLSGSRPRRVWALLDVSELIRPQARILDVGVGYGYSARQLCKAGCRVDALDVSSKALEGVAGFTELGFTPDQLESIPSGRYDLAISFLVAQHMSHGDLSHQLKHVVRSLKPSGTFAIQVAYPIDGQTADDSGDLKKAGMVLRTNEDFSAMTAAAGGRVVSRKTIGRFEEFGAAWMAYHIVRDSA